MTHDYLIVGAGTAGCVLANRLSADPGASVLLLEAGGKDDYFWIDIPVGYLYTIGNPRTDWCYRIEPDPGLNGRTILYARGRVLGGCSSINAMIYMRGQRSDYDHWASLGNRGWAWDDVLPVFKRSEDYQHGADECHGVGGEMRVEERRVSWEILDAWRDAAAECGIPKIAEFNRGDNFGNAYFQMNQRAGRRWSGTKAFLRPVLHRPNLTVRTDAQVRRITVDAGRCRPARDRDRAADGRAARGAARGDPGRRGHRLAADPAALGRRARRAAPGARHRGGPRSAGGRGEPPRPPADPQHLQGEEHGHPEPARELARSARRPWAWSICFFKTGPLTMPPSQLGAFARSDPSRASANIEWHVQPLSLDKFGDPLHKFNAITPSVANLQPTSRGHVRIKDADPLQAPAITLNYLSTDEDLEVAVAGLRFTRRIMAAQALARFEPHEWKPGLDVESDEALADAARDLGTTIFHPVGTCKMGRDPLAVVDDRLAVHGVAGLRVIDASVMPRITSGNTNAPTVMIAEKGAEFVIEDAAARGRDAAGGGGSATVAGGRLAREPFGGNGPPCAPCRGWPTVARMQTDRSAMDSRRQRS